MRERRLIPVAGTMLGLALGTMAFSSGCDSGSTETGSAAQTDVKSQQQIQDKMKEAMERKAAGKTRGK